MAPLKADTPPAFKIAAKPIDKANWLIQNALQASHLTEKEKLFEERLADVWRDNGEVDEAQHEALIEICHHLNYTKPEPDCATPPLLQASRLVQDDLVIMQKKPEGWVLAAASICFPSSWKLSEKFNRPLNDIHEHVPSFGPKSRNATLIARMFDTLQPDKPLMRGNWGLLPNDGLFQPHPHRIPDDFGELGQLTFRHERQTILKLKQTQDIVFTIRISCWSLSTIRSDTMLRKSLIEQIETMTPDQIHYKAIAKQRQSLLDWLKQP